MINGVVKRHYGDLILISSIETSHQARECMWSVKPWPVRLNDWFISSYHHQKTVRCQSHVKTRTKWGEDRLCKQQCEQCRLKHPDQGKPPYFSAPSQEKTEKLMDFLVLLKLVFKTTKLRETIHGLCIKLNYLNTRQCFGRCYSLLFSVPLNFGDRPFPLKNG